MTDTKHTKRVKFLVQKIIRDKPKIANEPDVVSKFIDLSPEDKIFHMKRKLVEEAQEVLEAEDRKDLITELADTYDVFQKICQLEGILISEVEEMSAKKRKERGGFDLCLYQEYLTLPETHRFVEQGRKQPEKYPEVPLDEES